MGCDLIKKTGKDQGQVSRGVNNLIKKGRLAETTARAIYIPSQTKMCEQQPLLIIGYDFWGTPTLYLIV